MSIKGNWETREVTINGVRLAPEYSQNVRNHSPDGFMWSYSGSGPSQLALAIMLYYLKNRETALQIYQLFKEKFIATLPRADFELDEEKVKAWIKEYGGAL